MKQQLVNNLFSFDINEAKHWNDIFGFNLFDRQESEEEDWEEEVENPKKEAKEPKQEEVGVCVQKDKNDNFEVKEVVEQWGSENEDYHKLKLPKENILMVDTKNSFEDFLKNMEGVSEVGVDVEFTPHLILKKVNIVQVNVYVFYIHVVGTKVVVACQLSSSIA